MSDGLQVIELEHPITIGKGENTKTITEMAVTRRLKGKDFKGIQANSIKFDDMMKLVSRVVSHPVSTIEELDSADLMRFVEVVNSFL